MRPTIRSALISKIVRRSPIQEPPRPSREQRQALITKLMNGLKVDEPPGRLPNLDGGFLFQFPLIDEEHPDRTLVITFAKIGHRTFAVKGFYNGGIRRIGTRTLRGDVPVHRAGAELILALYGFDFLTNATP